MKDLTFIAFICLVVATSWGDYNYQKALKYSLLFFEAQKSGNISAIPDYAIDWRGDSGLNDGAEADLNLTGGYYTNHGFVKNSFVLSWSLTVLSWSYLEYKEGFKDANQKNELLDTLRWGMDYLVKCHYKNSKFVAQVGNETSDNETWGKPENLDDSGNSRPVYTITKNAIGTDMASQATAAMAAGSLALKSSDSDFAKDLKKRAKKLWALAKTEPYETYLNIISEDRSPTSSQSIDDDLVWAALWMYKLLDDAEDLEFAEQVMAQVESTSGVFDFDNQMPANQLLLYQLTNNTVYREAFEESISYWLPSNVLTDISPGERVVYTSGGLAWQSQDPLPRAANAALLALLAANTGIYETELQAFAKSQIDYILGDGGRSYMVGFGSDSPRFYKHKAASCPTSNEECSWEAFYSTSPNPNELRGALVAGPESNDEYTDARNSTGSVVALHYNAGLTASLAGMMLLPEDVLETSSTTMATSTTASTTTNSSPLSTTTISPSSSTLNPSSSLSTSSNSPSITFTTPPTATASDSTPTSSPSTFTSSSATSTTSIPTPTSVSTTTTTSSTPATLPTTTTMPVSTRTTLQSTTTTSIPTPTGLPTTSTTSVSSPTSLPTTITTSSSDPTGVSATTTTSISTPAVVSTTPTTSPSTTTSVPQTTISSVSTPINLPTTTTTSIPTPSSVLTTTTTSSSTPADVPTTSTSSISIPVTFPTTSTTSLLTPTDVPTTTAFPISTPVFVSTTTTNSIFGEDQENCVATVIECLTDEGSTREEVCSTFSEKIDVCWADDNPCRHSDAVVTILDGYIHSTLEDCELHYCYKPISRCALIRIWFHFNVDEIQRSQFNNFCNSRLMFNHIMNCLNEAENTCEEFTTEGATGAVRLYTETFREFCIAGDSSNCVIGALNCLPFAFLTSHNRDVFEMCRDQGLVMDCLDSVQRNCAGRAESEGFQLLKSQYESTCGTCVNRVYSCLGSNWQSLDDLCRNRADIEECLTGLDHMCQEQRAFIRRKADHIDLACSAFGQF